MKNRLFAIVTTSAIMLGASAHNHDYIALIDNQPIGVGDDTPSALRWVAADGKLLFGLSGSLKGTISYDAGHPLDDPNSFITYNIPMQVEAGNTRLFQLSAQQSSFSANIVALPGTENQVGAFVLVNFLGKNYSPLLEYALFNYRGISMGWGYTLFCDTRSLITTIDYEGPASYAGVNNGVLQYRHRCGAHWNLGAGIELPVASFTVDEGKSAFINQRVPDVALAAGYDFTPDSWLRVSAILRNMYYRDMVANANKDNFGWGLQLTGSAPLLPGLKGYFQALYGKGVMSYFQDCIDGGLDMVPGKVAGRLDTVKAWGGYLGLEWEISDRWRAGVAYSHVRDYAEPYADGEVSWGDQCSWVQYCVANVFFDINSNLTAGAEYNYGRRVNFSHEQAHNNRFQLMLEFNF